MQRQFALVAVTALALGINATTALPAQAKTTVPSGGADFAALGFPDKCLNDDIEFVTDCPAVIEIRSDDLATTGSPVVSATLKDQAGRTVPIKSGDYLHIAWRASSFLIDNDKGFVEIEPVSPLTGGSYTITLKYDREAGRSCYRYCHSWESWRWTKTFKVRWDGTQTTVVPEYQQPFASFEKDRVTYRLVTQRVKVAPKGKRKRRPTSIVFQGRVNTRIENPDFTLAPLAATPGVLVHLKRGGRIIKSVRTTTSGTFTLRAALPYRKTPRGRKYLRRGYVVDVPSTSKFVGTSTYDVYH